MRIVTLGSGTGQATLLRGLRSYDCEVTAIVGVTDNGGHSGQLRRCLRQPQVGDTRQCLSALLEPTSLWGQLMGHRFRVGDMCGVSVGNILLAALTERYGGLNAASAALRQATGVPQRVLPVSDGDAQIGAELQDGRQVIGEWDIITRQPRSPVVRLFLVPEVAAHPDVVAAIVQADVLVCCPGSLLTGTLAVLLHPGMSAALAASRAPCVYICNLMTQPGQTDGYTTQQHLDLLQHYLGRRVDALLLNNTPLPPDLVALYARHEARPVVHALTDSHVAVYQADLVERPDAETLRTYDRPQGAGMAVGLHLIRHDAQRLAARLMALAQDWLERQAARPPSEEL
ncbi:MAG: uridine diphosphate-N-acetylglucosamine-binding protein YvcK [Candidatus Tectimicrobiota bacterium]